jgi:hypothetical protein
MSNFDESSFQIGVVKGDRVYMLLNYKVIYNTNPNNRELIIVIATINYNRKKVLAIIIFKGAYYLRGHF